jgi:hypothetical protein
LSSFPFDIDFALMSYLTNYGQKEVHK